MMKDDVGRRYRRQDALGTPFYTVDHQTIEDQTVTIRHRSMKQDRVAIADLKSIIERKFQ
jgi:glycyl-tRNA synthetase